MERLRPYLDHGILEIDNIAVGRGMRGIPPGRKNYLFVGSEAGGKAAAVAYTLIETAKLNAVDPHTWLAYTLARIPDYKTAKSTTLCHGAGTDSGQTGRFQGIWGYNLSVNPIEPTNHTPNSVGFQGPRPDTAGQTPSGNTH